MFNSVRVTTIVEAHALFKVSLFSHICLGNGSETCLRIHSIQTGHPTRKSVITIYERTLRTDYSLVRMRTIVFVFLS